MRALPFLAIILLGAFLTSACRSPGEAADVINIISYESDASCTSAEDAKAAENTESVTVSTSASKWDTPSLFSKASGKAVSPSSAHSSSYGFSSNGTSTSSTIVPSEPQGASSHSVPKAFGNIIDENLRKYINKLYFGRENSLVQPTLEELQSLDRIMIDENCGMKSLKGIEAAVNIEKLEIRANAVGDLSLLDWQQFKNLKVIAFNDTDVTSLRNINWIAENIEILVVRGAGSKGLLSDIEILWERFSSLTILNLGNNQLSDLSFLKVPMPSLTALYIYGNLSKEESRVFYAQYRALYPQVKVYWQ